MYTGLCGYIRLIRLVSKYWMRPSIMGSVMEIEEGVLLYTY